MEFNIDELTVNGVRYVKSDLYPPDPEPIEPDPVDDEDDLTPDPEPEPDPVPDPDDPVPTKTGLGFNMNDQRYFQSVQTWTNLMATPSFYSQDSSAEVSPSGYPTKGKWKILLYVWGGRRCKPGRYVVTHGGSGSVTESFEVAEGQQRVELAASGEIGEDLVVRHEDDNMVFTETFRKRATPAGWIRFLDPMWANIDSDFDQDLDDDVRVIKRNVMWVHKMITPEQIAKICNLHNVNPWLTIHHLMSDSKISAYAKRLHAALDDHLCVRVEHSNEVWNGAFPQNRYAKAQGGGTQKGLQGYHAMRSNKIGHLFANVFGNRAIGVLGCQLGSTGLISTAYSETDGGEHAGLPFVNSVAFNGYIGGKWSRDNQAVLAAGQMTHSQIHAGVKNDFETRVRPSLVKSMKMAERYGLVTDYYECGLHLHPLNPTRYPNAVEVLHKYAASEDAGELTGQLHDHFNEVSPDGVQCAYVDVKTGIKGKAFGHREFEMDPATFRWSAVMERMGKI